MKDLRTHLLTTCPRALAHKLHDCIIGYLSILSPSLTFDSKAVSMYHQIAALKIALNRLAAYRAENGVSTAVPPVSNKRPSQKERKRLAIAAVATVPLLNEEEVAIFESLFAGEDAPTSPDDARPLIARLEAFHLERISVRPPFRALSVAGKPNVATTETPGVNRRDA